VAHLAFRLISCAKTVATPPASGVLCVITHRRLHYPAYDICAIHNDFDCWVTSPCSPASTIYKDIFVVVSKMSKNKSRDNKVLWRSGSAPFL
jgi:hypothetical protein